MEQINSEFANLDFEKSCRNLHWWGTSGALPDHGEYIVYFDAYKVLFYGVTIISVLLMMVVVRIDNHADSIDEEKTTDWAVALWPAIVIVVAVGTGIGKIATGKLILEPTPSQEEKCTSINEVVDDDQSILKNDKEIQRLLEEFRSLEGC